ncbi:MAG TPA: hypothetical protein VGT44_12625, partial [Ktedonobacteraceae bacterium]|nr:hypothetical protein [Ktedonobacteraceae bacterium]
DTITSDNFTFTILATRGRRITKVRVERVRQQEQPQPIRLLPSPSSNASNEKNKSDEQYTSDGERSHIESRGA